MGRAAGAGGGADGDAGVDKGFLDRGGHVWPKDREVVIEKSATLRIVMEEWSLENLRMALMGGTPADDGSGNMRFEGFEGGQSPLQRRMSKFGFNPPNRVVYAVVNLDTLAGFDAGSGSLTRIDIRGREGILGVQRPLVVNHLRSLRRKHPNLTPEQMIQRLEKQYLAAVTSGDIRNILVARVGRENFGIVAAQCIGLSLFGPNVAQRGAVAVQVGTATFADPPGGQNLENLGLADDYGLYGHRVLGRTSEGHLIVEEHAQQTRTDDPHEREARPGGDTDRA